MDLNLTPRQEALQKEAREFLEAQCPFPVAKKCDESESGYSPELWKKTARMGWVGLTIPEKYGGGGGNSTDAGMLFEMLGRYVVPGPYLSSGVLGAQIILGGGSDEQKEQLLPAVAKGEKVLAVALTEPDYGWTPGCIHLKAAPNNGGFVLNGMKLFVPDAHIADQIIVAARTKETANPADGITLFLVDRKARGLTVHDMPGFIGERHNKLEFNNVEVPFEGIIGSTNRGWSLLNKPVQKATAVLCAYMVGGCQKVYELTVERSRTRKAFGQIIGRYQWIQTYVCDQANHLEAARWLMYEALFKLDAEKPEDEQALAVSLAKAVCSDAYYEIDSKAHEVHAGVGIHLDYPLYLYTKKARVLYSYFGDPPFHRRLMAPLLGM